MVGNGDKVLRAFLDRPQIPTLAKVVHGDSARLPGQRNSEVETLRKVDLIRGHWLLFSAWFNQALAGHAAAAGKPPSATEIRSACSISAWVNGGKA